MGFTGLVPSEHSSGTARRQGSITKAGNPHVRRVLAEAAWAYRHRPAVRGAHANRLEGRPPEVVAYSWKAKCRLGSTYCEQVARCDPERSSSASCADGRERACLVGGRPRPDHR